MVESVSASRKEVKKSIPDLFSQLHKEGRDMSVQWQDLIEERKEVMMGKPVFKGTRITVEHVLQELGAGMTDLELLDNYPTLRPEHIRAALLYAAAIVAMDETIYA
jgi:uncharacterized protein (DUF433 family)